MRRGRSSTEAPTAVGSKVAPQSRGAAGSPISAGPLHLTKGAGEGTQMDVKSRQPTAGDLRGTPPGVSNNNVDGGGPPPDQSHPTVAAAPGGAAPTAFYDRRKACPSDA